jgi:hypothetical protein
MQVCDEVEAFAFVLELDELPDCAVVVAEMQITGRLDSREDAHG